MIMWELLADASTLLASLLSVFYILRYRRAFKRNAYLERCLDSEYARATTDGRRKVHAWAVEANANLFGAEGSPLYVAKVRAALQDAERQFNPAKKEHSS